MSALEQITAYIESQEEPRRSDMKSLHRLIRKLMPRARLCFLDGKAPDGRTVSNPQVGYGIHSAKISGGKARELFQIGFSGNTAGISVYIMGIEDKQLLAREFGKKLGKAKVTGYCIRFKSLASIDVDVLAQAIRRGIAESIG